MSGKTYVTDGATLGTAAVFLWNVLKAVGSRAIAPVLIMPLDPTMYQQNIMNGTPPEA